MVQPTVLCIPCTNRANKLLACLNAPSPVLYNVSSVVTKTYMKDKPCCFPFKQCARAQLVRAQLKDATFLAGWGGGEKGKFLRKLCSPGAKKRPKSIVGSLMLYRSKKKRKDKNIRKVQEI